MVILFGGEVEASQILPLEIAQTLDVIAHANLCILGGDGAPEGAKSG
jgi:hypothetical protein